MLFNSQHTRPAERAPDLIDKNAMQSAYFAFSLSQGMDAAFSNKFGQSATNVQISLKNSKEFKDWHRQMEDFIDDTINTTRKLTHQFGKVCYQATKNERLKDYIGIVQSFDYFQDRANVANQIEKINLVSWGLKEMSQLLLNAGRDEGADIMSIDNYDLPLHQTDQHSRQKTDQPKMQTPTSRTKLANPGRRLAETPKKKMVRKPSNADATEYIDDHNKSGFLPEISKSRAGSMHESAEGENKKGQTLSRPVSKQKLVKDKNEGPTYPLHMSVDDIGFEDSSIRNQKQASPFDKQSQPDSTYKPLRIQTSQHNSPKRPYSPKELPRAPPSREKPLEYTRIEPKSVRGSIQTTNFQMPKRITDMQTIDQPLSGRRSVHANQSVDSSRRSIKERYPVAGYC